MTEVCEIGRKWQNGGSRLGRLRQILGFCLPWSRWSLWGGSFGLQFIGPFGAYEK